MKKTLEFRKPCLPQYRTEPAGVNHARLSRSITDRPARRAVWAPHRPRSYVLVSMLNLLGLIRSTVIMRVTMASCLAAMVACSSDPVTGPQDVNLGCVVSAVGTTDGDRNVLGGRAAFRFGEQERPAEVALYLFEMFDHAEDGSFRVHVFYQFVWENGDMFLSHDHPLFIPLLEPERYTFQTPLEIVTGGGMFAELAGEHPFTLSATIQFGPPAAPDEPKSAAEEFRIGGTLCTS